MRLAILLAALLGALGVSGFCAPQAQAQTQTEAQAPVLGKSPAAQVQRGQALAQTLCASCHAVGRTGQSPLRNAPAFRTLHLRYPVENLAESLAEGITTAHPGMPQFRFEEDQIGDLLAYLKSLER